MIVVNIEFIETKNENNEITSLEVKFVGEFEYQNTIYNSIQNVIENFDTPKTELNLNEKIKIANRYINEKIQNILNDLKTQSNVSNLGKLIIKI